MSDNLIQPFIDATRTAFDVMLGTVAEPEEPCDGTGVLTGYDVSGIVGLSKLGGSGSRNHGSLVLSFPQDVACRAVGRVLGVETLPSLDQDVADGIGELINVIAGLAKRGLAEIGIQDCRTTLPNVILGSKHRVFHQREVERWGVRFTSDIGEFLLQCLLMFPFRQGGIERPAAATDTER